MRIGIDLGGTKIEAQVLDEQGAVQFQQRLPTPQGDYAATLQIIKILVEQAEAQVQRHCSIGIGTPGSPSKQNGSMKNCNSTCLNHQFFQRDIESLLTRPVRIANDANCFALSEAIDGAAATANVVFAVIIGTGVGAGLVVNKQLIVGANNIAGEWGHNPMSANALSETLSGRACYCGRSDCIETYLSGPGFAETFRRLSGEIKRAQQIVDAAVSGQVLALKALDIYQQQLAMALSQVVNILDPDVIVLGGGMSKTTSLYQQVPQLWHQYIFNDDIATQLVPAKYGDASGVRGAAWLWPKP